MIPQPNRNEEAKLFLAQVYGDLRKNGSSDRIGEAASFLTSEVDAHWQGSIANVLVHDCFLKGNFPDALVYCRKWLACDPDNLVAVNSHLSILARLKRWEEMYGAAKEELSRHPEDFRLHSAACQALGCLGRLAEAKAHGTQCLALKHRSANGEAFNAPEISLPDFSQSSPGKNIISFSLFGNGERYFKGAIANAQAARFIYPQWTCRFYVDDTLPSRILQQLASYGAQVRTVNGLPARKYGTFWRFLVADDAGVDRYLVRDCDSVVNVRERVAVDEWIDSGRHFHVMRDFYTHSELVMAGMWGGVAGALPPMGKAFCTYVEDTIVHRTLDQDFLRDRMWPTICRNVLVHDSQFAFDEPKDFPRLGRLPLGRHVGYGEF